MAILGLDMVVASVVVAATGAVVGSGAGAGAGAGADEVATVEFFVEVEGFLAGASSSARSAF